MRLVVLCFCFLAGMCFQADRASANPTPDSETAGSFRRYLRLRSAREPVPADLETEVSSKLDALIKAIDQGGKADWDAAVDVLAWRRDGVRLGLLIRRCDSLPLGTCSRVQSAYFAACFEWVPPIGGGNLAACSEEERQKRGSQWSAAAVRLLANFSERSLEHRMLLITQLGALIDYGGLPRDFQVGAAEALIDGVIRMHPTNELWDIHHAAIVGIPGCTEVGDMGVRIMSGYSRAAGVMPRATWVEALAAGVSVLRPWMGREPADTLAAYFDPGDARLSSSVVLGLVKLGRPYGLSELVRLTERFSSDSKAWPVLRTGLAVILRPESDIETLPKDAAWWLRTARD